MRKAMIIYAIIALIANVLYSIEKEPDLFNQFVITAGVGMIVAFFVQMYIEFDI